MKKKKKKNHVTIGGRNIFDQPIENDLKICDNIREIATGHSDDYTNWYLLDYLYFKKCYKLIADPKAMQQINFTGNLSRAQGATMLFLIEEAKETF